MNDCIFCKICNGKIPSTKVYENQYIYAFEDISPAAPVHVLVIPKKHISSAQALTDEDTALLGELFKGINEVTRIMGVDQSGFRIVSNIGKDGGQSVKHLHFHVLGGKVFSGNFG